MEGVDKAVTEILEVAAGEHVGGQYSLETQGARGEGEHAAPVHKGTGAEAVYYDGLVEPARGFNESVVAAGVAGIEAGHLAAHPVAVPGIVDIGIVVKKDAVTGIEGNDIDIIGQPFAGHAKDLIEESGLGDQ